MSYQENIAISSSYNSYFVVSFIRVTYILLQHVSASRGHHQVYTLLLKLLPCHVSMFPMNALLFLILKYLKVYKTSDSGALHLVHRCECLVCEV
jgi:hypothetical protein